MRLQKLLKATCSFVNRGYSNSLDVILLGWLPNERIDFSITKLAYEALYVTSFPSYLKLSFIKLSRNLRSKDEFLINNYDKNSNTFIGKARILFNNLPYQIRSISNFKIFSRDVKKYLLDLAQAKYFYATSEPIQPYLLLNLLFCSSSFTNNLEKFCFIFHSLSIYFSISIATTK